MRRGIIASARFNSFESSPPPTGGPISIGANAASTSGPASPPYNNVTLTMDTQGAGSGFVVFVCCEGGHAAINATCTDNKGNTYTRVTPAAGGAGLTRTFAFFSDGAAGGGAGHQFIVTTADGSSSTYPVMLAVELIGSDLSVDQYADNFTSADPHTSPSITPASDGQMVLSFEGGRTTAAFSVVSPFNLLANQPDGSNWYTVAAANYEQAVAAPVACTWQQAGNTYSINHIISIRSGT